MKKHQDGFSLIELLIVVVVIGIVAALAVPALQKATRAAENGNTFATMRTIASTQVGFYQTNGRFAKVTELNNIMANGIGTNSGNDVNRGRWVFSMTPDVPSDAELREGYVLTATRNVPSEGITYKYELTQNGQIRQILPACSDGLCS
jgi:prepilin-type N-terminal cleavage/methylation domain-containing protein